MGCEYCKRNCSENCDQNSLEPGRINKEQKNEKITDLVDNLTGLTKEYSPKNFECIYRYRFRNFLFDYGFFDIIFYRNNQTRNKTKNG